MALPGPRAHLPQAGQHLAAPHAPDDRQISPPDLKANVVVKPEDGRAWGAAGSPSKESGKKRTRVHSLLPGSNGRHSDVIQLQSDALPTELRRDDLQSK